MHLHLACAILSFYIVEEGAAWNGVFNGIFSHVEKLITKLTRRALS